MRKMKLSALIVSLVWVRVLPAALWALNGQVVYTEGDVSIHGGSSGVRDAAIGDKLGPGDVVQTAANALADSTNLDQAYSDLLNQDYD